MSEEQPSTEHAAETPFVDVPRTETHPVEPPANDPRRRLRELLAIPERDRADAVWDEIISLEIDLAPGNRAQTPQGDVARRQESGRRPEQGGRRPEQGQRQNPGRAKPGGRFFKKRKRGSGSGAPPER